MKVKLVLKFEARKMIKKMFKRQNTYDYVAIFRSVMGYILFKLQEKYFSDISQNSNRARINYLTRLIVVVVLIDESVQSYIIGPGVLHCYCNVLDFR